MEHVDRPITDVQSTSEEVQHADRSVKEGKNANIEVKSANESIKEIKVDPETFTYQCYIHEDCIEKLKDQDGFCSAENKLCGICRDENESTHIKNGKCISGSGCTKNDHCPRKYFCNLPTHTCRLRKTQGNDAFNCTSDASCETDYQCQSNLECVHSSDKCIDINVCCPLNHVNFKGNCIQDFRECHKSKPCGIPSQKCDLNSFRCIGKCKASNYEIFDHESASCRKKCWLNEDCTSKQLCYYGFCNSLTDIQGCLTKNQCSNDNAICVDTVCIQEKCSRECESGTHCVAGQCAPIIKCIKDVNCPPLMICSSTSYRCMPKICYSNQDCDGGVKYFCYHHQCYLRFHPPSCENHQDCGKFQMCIDRKCLYACKGNKNCKNNQVCEFG